MAKRIAFPSFFFGARGTGKSTWLHTLDGDAAVLDLLNSELHRRFSAYPERLNDWLEANQKEFVIIDEIQPYYIEAKKE